MARTLIQNYKASFLFRVVVCSFLIFTPGRASQRMQEFDCTKLPSVTWKEKSIVDFDFLYPEEYDELIANLTSLFGGDLKTEYAKFVRLYDIDLALPINVRVYPGIQSYYCLNIIAPTVGAGEIHSHIGIREIVLFGDRIQKNPTQMLNDALDIFRYELGVLFIEKVTEGKAPPGLIAGTGVYMMDPYHIFEPLNIAEGTIGNPERTWRTLWEDKNTLTSPEMRMQAVSIVAYLVDSYGWNSFLQFLNQLRTSESYKQSLNTIYQMDFSSLESEWEKYYPLYYQGRWRAHVLYDFDLSPYEAMIAGGAYTDVLLGLKDVSVFLEQNGETGKLGEVKILQEQAKKGQEASSLVLQSRTALQNQQYQISIQLADKAQSIFEQLGNQNRIDELNNYRTIAQEVLTLQAEFKSLSQNYHFVSGSTTSFEKMIQISQRLTELGEPKEREEILSMLYDQELASIEQQKRFFFGVGSVAALLLILRLILMRFKAPPEVL